MGKDAGDAFESNPNVLEAYNKLQIQPGTLAPEFESFGIVLLGNWRGIPLYVSEEQYEDSSGTMTYFVPPKEVLVAASGIQGVMAYAGISQVSEDGRGMEVYSVGASRSFIGTPPARTIAVCGFPAVRSRFRATPIVGR